MKLLESYLETADKNQKMMILIIFIILLGLLLNHFVPPMLEQRSESKQSIYSMQLSLSKNSVKKLERELAKKQEELMTKKENLSKEKASINYSISNLYKIKHAFFNDKRWVNTLDDILRFSVKNNLKIDSLKSSDAVDNLANILKHKKNIELSGVGSYVDIVSLIQYIENFETLLSFNSIEMTLAKEGVEFSFDLNAYGIGL